MSTKLFINGEVITVDDHNNVVQAVAIRDNKIIAVGSNEEILALQNKSSEIIDLNGKTLIPGFIEPHAHITIYGVNYMSISCKELGSIEELLAEISKKAQSTEKGEWIRAWGIMSYQLKKRDTRPFKNLIELRLNTLF